MKKIIFLILLLSLYCQNIITNKIDHQKFYPTIRDIYKYNISNNLKISKINQLFKDKYYHLFKEYKLNKKSKIIYQNIENSKDIFSIEVYEFSNDLYAYGFNSRLSKSYSKILTKFSAVYYKDNSIFLNKGNYCFKITNLKINNFIFKDIIEFWTNSLNSIKNNLPAYIDLFNNNRSVYYPQYNILNKYLKNIYFQKYDQSSDISLFYNNYISPENAYQQYSELLDQKQKNITLYNTNNYKGLFQYKNKKFIFIACYKNWIIGSLNVKSLKNGKIIIEKLINLIDNYEMKSSKY